MWKLYTIKEDSYLKTFTTLQSQLQWTEFKARVVVKVVILGLESN